MSVRSPKMEIFEYDLLQTLLELSTKWLHIGGNCAISPITNKTFETNGSSIPNDTYFMHMYTEFNNVFLSKDISSMIMMSKFWIFCNVALGCCKAYKYPHMGILKYLWIVPILQESLEVVAPVVATRKNKFPNVWRCLVK